MWAHSWARKEPELVKVRKEPDLVKVRKEPELEPGGYSSSRCYKSVREVGSWSNDRQCYKPVGVQVVPKVK